MLKTFRTIALAGVSAVALMAPGAVLAAEGLVGIAMPTKTSARWIDDGNNMQTALVRYTPPFKLISRHLRPLLGIEHRKARHTSPSYWSPDQGYGAAFAGVEGDWSDDRWSLAASLQRGWRLYGEASASWSASLSGSYDFGQNWTAGARAWVVRNRREDAPYRGGAITLFVEHRW